MKNRNFLPALLAAICLLTTMPALPCAAAETTASEAAGGSSGTLPASGSDTDTDSGSAVDAELPPDEHEYQGSGFTLTYSITDNAATIAACSAEAKTVAIPDALGGSPVTTIGEGSFSACTELTEVTMGNKITTIAPGAFYHCTKLAKITLSTGLTTIQNDAFSACESLTALDLPEGLLTIEDSAFAFCKGFTSMQLPASLTTLGNYVFDNCTSLERFTLADGSKSLSVKDDILFDYACTTLLKFPEQHAATTYTLPDTVTAIAPRGFLGSAKLTDIDLNKVQTLGQDAFYHCTALTQIRIPDGVTALPGAMFAECAELSCVTIPEGVTEIGDYCFAICPKLMELHLPATIAKMGNFCFGFDFDTENQMAVRAEGDRHIYATLGSIGEQYAKDNNIPCTTGKKSNWILLVIGGVALVLIGVVVFLCVRHKPEPTKADDASEAEALPPLTVPDNDEETSTDPEAADDETPEAPSQSE